MRDLRTRRAVGCAALLVLLAGCGGHKQVVNVTPAAGQKMSVEMTLEMKASSFDFAPSVIIAQKGSTLVLNITNVSGEAHNITVKNPAGKIIKSEDLPAHKTVTVQIRLATAGFYPFYCDKPFHTTLGMKGHIEAK